MKILLASIYPYAFILLYISIPFDDYIRAFPNLLLGILLIAFPFIVTKNDFKKLLAKPLLIFIIFFIFLLINAFLFGRITDDFVVIKKMLIPIGLVILYIPVQDFKKLNKAIIFSSIAAILFSIIKFIILVNNTGIFNINYFQESLDILLIDKLYIGFLCVLSILISYQSLKLDYHPNNKYYLISIILNSLFIILIFSKIFLIVLIAIVLLRQFYGEKRKLRLLISAVILCITMGSMFYIFKPDLKNIISFEKSIESINYEDNALPWGFRNIIWNCASNMIQNGENQFSGIGFKNTNQNLISCYEESITDSSTRDYFLDKRFNSHNQYLDFYISSGIVGFLLFVVVLLVMIMKYKKHFFAMALLTTIILIGLIENYFHRQIGAYYFGYILIILLINNSFFMKSEKEKLNK